MNHSEHSSASDGYVLVVDDDDSVRHMLSLALEIAGFEVVEARTQRQAHVHLAHARPDALILNLRRSHADGLEVLRRVRARDDLAQVPIVFLAGSDSDDFRWRALRAGADWFGLRPLGMVELQKRVGQLIRQGRPRLKLIAGCDCPSGGRRLKLTG